MAPMPGLSDAVVSNASTRALLATLAARGHESARLVSACGLSPSAIGGSTGVMRLADMVALWDEAERITGDWSLGVETAAYVPPGAYGALDFVAITSHTVKDAFRATARYLRTAHGAAELILTSSATSLALEFDTPRIGHLHEHRSSEFTFAVFLHRSWAATGVRWTPVEVDFVGPRPRVVEPFERVLGTRVRFGRPCNRLVVPASVAGLPHLQRDDDLCSYLHDYLDVADRVASRGTTIADRCAEILQTATFQDAHIDAVARRLGMSARSLQRALLAGGDTFRAIRDGVWCGRARTLLRNGTPTPEIAIALGFSEASAFHRAFRRWTGGPPGQYRPDRKRRNLSV